MPASTCPKCSHHSFELAVLVSTDSKQTVSAVQCEKCGTIVGVLEDTGPILSKIEKRLRALERKLSA
jgi:transcription elongation factor Elf1